MQTTTVNRLTWQDIAEIHEILQGINEDAFDTDEAYYGEVLIRLCRKYKTLPACKERYSQILPVAERITGIKNGKERTFERTVLHCIIASRLKEEGFGVSDIGRAMKNDHSTVCFYLNKKVDFFSLPLMYEREVRWFKLFNEELDNGRGTGND